MWPRSTKWVNFIVYGKVIGENNAGLPSCDNWGICMVIVFFESKWPRYYAQGSWCWFHWIFFFVKAGLSSASSLLNGYFNLVEFKSFKKHEGSSMIFSVCATYRDSQFTVVILLKKFLRLIISLITKAILNQKHNFILTIINDIYCLGFIKHEWAISK